MSRPVLAVLVLACVAAAWMWGLPPVLAPWPPPAARAPAVRAPTVVPAVRLPQLDAGATVGTAPPDGARNPFMGGGAPRHDVARASAPSAVASRPVPAVPPPPTWPRVELIGLAEAREGAGVVRTAVIAGPRGVQHARPGDVIEQVYRLERITGAAVDLRLLPEDRMVHLVLRP